MYVETAVTILCHRVRSQIIGHKNKQTLDNRQHTQLTTRPQHQHITITFSSIVIEENTVKCWPIFSFNNPFKGLQFSLVIRNSHVRSKIHREYMSIETLAMIHHWPNKQQTSPLQGGAHLNVHWLLLGSMVLVSCFLCRFY